MSRRVLLLVALLSLLPSQLRADKTPDSTESTKDVPSSSGEDEQRADPLEVFLGEYEAQTAREVSVNLFDGRQGSPTAPVRVVVFSDMQCRPYCQRSARGLADLLQRYDGLIEVVYKNYPLNADCNPLVTSRHHAFACSLAKGLQCAGEQDAFWAYHDQAYEQSVLDDSTAAWLVGSLGLDKDRWTQCIQGREVSKQLARQAVDGGRLEVRGTPNFFINGRQIRGSAMDRVEAAIRWELSELGRDDLPPDESGVFPR